MLGILRVVKPAAKAEDEPDESKIKQLSDALEGLLKQQEEVQKKLDSAKRDVTKKD